MGRRKVIPSLGIQDGRVVKGVQFVELRDAGDPVDHARVYNQEGADELIFLNLSSLTTEGRQAMLGLVERVAAAVEIPFTVGGGVADLDHFRDLLSAGATKVAINSAGVLDPSLVIRAVDAYGSQRVVGGVDARWSGSGWRVHTHGGRRPTGLDAVEWCQDLAQRGVGEIFLTSMDRDGTRAGYDTDLIRFVREVVEVPIIASGGAGQLSDFLDAARAGASGVVAGSLFHFRIIGVGEVKAALEGLGA